MITGAINDTPDEKKRKRRLGMDKQRNSDSRGSCVTPFTIQPRRYSSHDDVDTQVATSYLSLERPESYFLVGRRAVDKA